MTELSEKLKKSRSPKYVEDSDKEDCLCGAFSISTGMLLNLYIATIGCDGNVDYCGLGGPIGLVLFFIPCVMVMAAVWTIFRTAWLEMKYYRDNPDDLC